MAVIKSSFCSFSSCFKLILLHVGKSPSFGHIFGVGRQSVLHARHGGNDGDVGVGIVTSYGLVGIEARPLGDVGEIALGVVLTGWCPTSNDLTKGVVAVLHAIGAKQDEGGSVAVGHAHELHEGGVGLSLGLALPTVAGVPDVQGVVVAKSSGKHDGN